MSESTNKRKPGRPKAKINGEDVFNLAKIGATLNEIADWFKVDVNTIRRRFKDEIMKGKCDMRLSLRRAQLKTALGGNVVMQIWLGKQMLNQTDNGTFDDEELVDEISFDIDE